MDDQAEVREPSRSPRASSPNRRRNDVTGAVVRLRPAEEFLDQALMIAAVERERLRALGVVGELVLTGGSSVAGALTRGDVDLHLRVRPVDFASVVALLRRTYVVVHPEIWAPTLATFGVPAALEAGMAVTPAGSDHDLRFTRTWQLLAADPALLSEYNAVKLADTAGENTYEERKSAFFDRLLGLWPTHRAGGRAAAGGAPAAAPDPLPTESVRHDDVPREAAADRRPHPRP